MGELGKILPGMLFNFCDAPLLPQRITIVVRLVVVRQDAVEPVVEAAFVEGGDGGSGAFEAEAFLELGGFLGELLDGKASVFVQDAFASHFVGNNQLGDGRVADGFVKGVG